MSSILQQTTRRTHSLMATSYRLRSTCPPGTRIASVRQKSQEQKWFHSVGGLRAQKDTQHKDSLKPRSTEYSKSGGGDQAAATESAFDPSTSDPDEGTKKVERESDTGEDPMSGSPGNQHISKQKDAETSATAKSSGEAGEGERNRTSSGGSPNKAGGGKSG